MKLYDQIFDVVKQFRKLFSPGPVTNADVSGSITAEIFLIVSYWSLLLQNKQTNKLENIQKILFNIKYFGNK